MREMKFRVWDKKRKMMYRTHLLEWDEKGISKIIKWSGIEIELDCPLMQFTGLLDKNGLEIYEGDIVKLFDRPIYADVKWDDFSGAFRLYGLNGWQDSHPWFSLEVIGNIYENPDLL